MSLPKYYFAKSKLQIVKDLKDLGPAYDVEIGKVYHAFQWSAAKEDYLCVATGVYLGNGGWIDSVTTANITPDFKWADYLVERK